MMMGRSVFLGAIAAAFFLAMPVAATAEMIAAYFSDGNGTTLPDAYTGATGSGWTSGWVWSRNGTGSTGATTVTDTDPLHTGDGNYLSVSVKNNNTEGADTAYRAGFFRDYKTAGALDFTKDFTIGYSIRVDSEDFGLSASSSDQITLKIGSKAYYTADTGDCFNIYFRGDGTLRYLTGDPDTQTNTTITAADFDVNVGDVYDFDITVHVADQTYDLAVTNTDTTDTYQATGMGWRYTATSVGKLVGLFAQELTGGDTIAFSFDNLEIAEVPEPGALVLLTAGLVGLLIRRSK